mgnify:FL=1
MRDPLLLLTAIVGLALLLVVGRYTVTGQLDEKILAALGTVLSGLIAALANRRKGSDGKGNPDA